ncbi:hypothetical protein [Actinokineospora sp. UTMC 2448]|uniref:hypothetical protein n=1 Tax=Actinokineospora sp. UTMC 2448 TaxID=2268449 RepID=UPI002164E0CC|nr:hypothetical protein [Actinokineospora sp. UTMC 2448]UVS78415.1 hypothetical protein Actkin_02148 [Actinokineospora sp. UTMC 2448]
MPHGGADQSEHACEISGFVRTGTLPSTATGHILRRCWPATGDYLPTLLRGAHIERRGRNALFAVTPSIPPTSAVPTPVRDHLTDQPAEPLSVYALLDRLVLEEAFTTPTTTRSGIPRLTARDVRKRLVATQTQNVSHTTGT